MIVQNKKTRLLADHGNLLYCGAKAASKRDRKEKSAKPAKSQLKSNEKAKDIQCNVCKLTFLKTVRAPALTEHATSKHKKTIKECFPDFEAS
ncbi:hypothetical protein OnM2_014021 [Erysiphe neolycopersici]|uniref:At2g23090-like zinc-binding domain-containing protein n=1 Tax=Erysiphe neolycopersici TaxID=212602 RepID=A0A420I5N3_9PEZI|nr:hypothetical protein OnM2_014021 [Erysiphe neolycopersici]